MYLTMTEHDEEADMEWVIYRNGEPIDFAEFKSEARAYIREYRYADPTAVYTMRWEKIK